MTLSRHGRQKENVASRIADAKALALWSAAVLACLMACDLPEPPPKPNARSDMRSLATAIEAYCLDFNAYPLWSVDPSENANGFAAAEAPQLKQVPTFRIKTKTNEALVTLTTPIAYVLTYFPDQYGPMVKAPPSREKRRKDITYWLAAIAGGKIEDNTQPTFGYWRPMDEKASGWILWSPGPDGDYDLTIENVSDVYDPSQTAATPKLLDLTYDPTNGAVSNGDLWRIRQ